MVIIIDKGIFTLVHLTGKPSSSLAKYPLFNTRTKKELRSWYSSLGLIIPYTYYNENHFPWEGVPTTPNTTTRDFKGFSHNSFMVDTEGVILLPSVCKTAYSQDNLGENQVCSYQLIGRLTPETTHVSSNSVAHTSAVIDVIKSDDYTLKEILYSLRSKFGTTSKMTTFSITTEKFLSGLQAYLDDPEYDITADWEIIHHDLYGRKSIKLQDLSEFNFDNIDSWS